MESILDMTNLEILDEHKLNQRKLSDKMLTYYLQNKTDYRIAIELNTTLTKVTTWRDNFGLPANIYKSWTGEVNSLYNLGLSDERISEIMDLSKSYIQIWRNKSMKPNNMYTNNKLRAYNKLIKQGHTHESVSNLLDISKEEYFKIRIKANNINK